MNNMPNVSEERKMQILEKYITTSEGRAKIAASMTLPLRTQRDYKAVGRRAYLVHQLAMGALPQYDRDPDVKAYVVGEEGEGIVSIAKAKRVQYPLFEIASVPMTSITEIKQKRYDLVLRMVDKAKSEIMKAEDLRAFGTMNAAAADPANPNVPINTTAPLSANILSDAFARVDENLLHVQHVFMHSREFADLRKFGRDYYAPEDQQTIMRTGLVGNIYGASIITTPFANIGRVYVCAEPEFFGRVPVRTELTVISADNPIERKIGFSCFENLGFGLHNNLGLQTINVAR